jgi:hypothetical protein
LHIHSLRLSPNTHTLLCPILWLRWSFVACVIRVLLPYPHPVCALLRDAAHAEGGARYAGCRGPGPHPPLLVPMRFQRRRDGIGRLIRHLVAIDDASSRLSAHVVFNVFVKYLCQLASRLFCLFIHSCMSAAFNGKSTAYALPSDMPRYCPQRQLLKPEWYFPRFGAASLFAGGAEHSGLPGFLSDSHITRQCVLKCRHSITNSD